MIIGMFIFPIIYLRKNDNAVCNPVDLGLEIDFPLDVILITLVIIFLIVVKTMIFKGDIVFPLVQNKNLLLLKSMLLSQISLKSLSS